MHEDLKRGERQGRRCVDDRRPRAIPAAAAQARAFAVESATPGSRDAPDADQL
jgi:hypothetical protein